AREELERLLDIKPDSSLALYRLGRLAMRDKKYEVARRILEDARLIAPDNANIHYSLGGALMGLGKHQAALDSFKEAQRLNPRLVVAGLRVADCLIALNRYDEGLTLLRDLSRKHRRSGMVHARIGDIYTAMGRYAYAVEEYRAAVFNSPELQEKNPQVAGLIESKADDETLAKQFQTALAGMKTSRQTQSSEGPMARFRGKRQLGGRRRGALAARRA
ncbi:MAG: tetratricopeptide repeat protein, partial [Pseudorhodoplanes sp.]